MSRAGASFGIGLLKINFNYYNIIYSASGPRNSAIYFSRSASL
jgi:hypothetical protein